MNIELYEKCLMGLIKDSILGTNTYKISDDINIDKLLYMAKRHNVLNVIYPVLIANGISNENMMREFSVVVLMETKQQYYLDKIREKFEQEHIRFVCMKGSYIKTLYPETYMRSSSDLDIFVDDENTDKVRDIMEGLGFKTERFSHQMQDDVYLIENYVHIEIHRKLISNKCPWDEKCQDIIDRIVPKSEGSYEYVMTVEDFYLHMIGHMAKHMKYSGFGIRMLIDVWIYLDKFDDVIDNEILNKRLKYCGLDTFNSEIIKLIDYWFCDKDADEKTKTLGRYVLESGIFGTTEQLKATEAAQNMGDSNSHSKMMFKKFLKMFFLPYRNMCLIYPKLSGKPYLLPYFWIVRAFDVVLHKRDKIGEVSDEYGSVDIEYAKQINNLKKGLGL